MKKRWIVAILILALVGVWAWPYVGAYRLADAAARSDSQAVADRIDFEALRRSLAHQIVRAYLRRDPRAEKLGALGRSVAMGVGTTVAEPYLADLVAPDTVSTLLSQGKLKPVNVEGRSLAWNGTIPKFADALNGSALNVFFSSYYEGLTSFALNGLGNSENPDLALHLHLSDGTWKLAGIDLPSALLDKIADDIIAKQKAEKAS